MNSFFKQVQTAFQTPYFRAWVMASVGGLVLYSWVISMVISILMGALPEAAIARVFGTGFVLIYLLLRGLILGTCQWLVLNQKVRRAYQWIVATALGAMLGEIAMIALIYPLFDFLADPSIWRIAPLFRQAAISPLTIKLVNGLTIGLAQWLFWRGRVQRAQMWIVAVVVVQVLLAGVDQVMPQPLDLIGLVAMDNSRRLIFMVAQFLRTVVSGIVLGSVTGVLLVQYVAQIDALRLNQGAPENS